MSPPELPPELVYEIVRHLMPPSSHVRQNLKKLGWPCICNFSISSRLFRRAALDFWFSSLFIRQGSDWDEVERFTPVELPQIVSRLHIFPAALDPQAVNRLKRYKQLRTLSVNMHVVWQDFPESSHLAKLLVPCIPQSITDLEISCTSVEQFQDLVPLLASIARACPSLRRLGFYSAASDCTECLDETRLPFPIPERSPCQLAEDISQSLSNLKWIQSLSLPIHLSDEDICERHLTGHRLMRANEQASDSNCDKCVEQYGEITRENEEIVAGILMEKLRTLQRVYFGSWVYGRGKGGVRFVRSASGSELKYELVPSYIGTQEWDGGRI
ncbi:unnamed protein product [Rhizoctonia solani]|uniref:Uncharacterized protein n=1 Tax=Rhizoctonia solani TaxID=456999 RepID=A0A8H3DGL3_9AGAM|nr:unnamed protein product [Rhizoctonia solani]CAE6526360.1 unnamed protein product [Rhizoctonia solani]